MSGPTGEDRAGATQASFALGLLGSCLGAGAMMFVINTAGFLLRDGRVTEYHFDSSAIIAGITALLAIPATVVGVVLVRWLPAAWRRVWVIGLLGAGLGLSTIVVLGLLYGGLQYLKLLLAGMACASGLAGAVIGWLAGLREAVR